MCGLLLKIPKKRSELGTPTLYLIDSYLILSYITEGILTSLLIVILCGIIYQYCIAVMLGCISSVPFL